MAKKKELDYTNQPQAMTKEDVDQQDSRTRLWQSLDYGYGNKIKKSNEDYDNAISETDRQAQSRGMGRSSYNNQTMANLRDKKVEAANDIRSEQIADYQSRVGDIENQEKEDERWERQFAENQRQYNENLAFQQGEAQRQQANWEKEYGANRADTAWSQNFQTKQFGYQQERDTVADNQLKSQLEENIRQFNEGQKLTREENALNRSFQTSERIAQQNFSAEQAQLNRDAEVAMQELQNAFSAEQNELSRNAQRDLQILSQNWQSDEAEKSRAAQEALQRLEQEFTSGENAKNRAAQEALQKLEQAFTAEQNALNRAQADEQFRIQQAFNEKQWEASVDQWKQQFEYTKMSNDQQMKFNAILTAAQNGGDVSDEILAAVGLTREDYNAMKAKAQSTGGGGSGGNKGGDQNETNPYAGLSISEKEALLAARLNGRTETIPGVNSYNAMKKDNTLSAPVADAKTALANSPSAARGASQNNVLGVNLSAPAPTYNGSNTNTTQQKINALSSQLASSSTSNAQKEKIAEQIASLTKKQKETKDKLTSIMTKDKNN